MEIHYQLKNLYKSIRFKPELDQQFKDIHGWKFEVIKGKLLNKDAVLKITHNFYQDGYFQILNEIAADNRIKRFEHKSKTRAPHYRRVLLTGSDENYTWLAKEFVGDPLGVSYWVINPKFKKNQRSLINQAFNELDRLHAIPYPEFQHFIPQRFPSVDSSTIDRRLSRIYKKNNSYKKSLHFFLDNQSLLHEKKSFIHGDFIISNLIVSRGIIYLTDFEYAASDHPMTDLAQLWQYSQINLPIRKEIIRRYLQTKHQEQIFLSALARSLLAHLIGIGKVNHKINSKIQAFEEENSVASFELIGKGIRELLKLAEVQAKKYAPLERELINKPYR